MINPFKRTQEQKELSLKPDEVMEGVCQTCKNKVVAPRWQCNLQPNRWYGDIPAVECQAMLPIKNTPRHATGLKRCGAVVLMRPKKKEQYDG